MHKHPIAEMKRTESIEGRLSTAQPIMGYNCMNGVSDDATNDELCIVRERLLGE